MKLLGSTIIKIAKDKNGGKMPYLKTTEEISIYFNVVNNSYQQYSRVLYTFVSNKLFGQLLDISAENFIFRKIFNSKILYIEVWFTNRNSHPLKIEDK